MTERPEACDAESGPVKHPVAASGIAFADRSGYPLEALLDERRLPAEKETG